MDENKKIIDLTAQELETLGYLTDKVAPGVKKRVEEVRANPKHLGEITVFMVECMIRRNSRQAAAAPRVADDPLAPPTSPTSPTSTVSDADTVFSRYSGTSDAFTVVTPDLITQYERDFYYHGLSGNPPPLLWRSDLEQSPFPVPTPGDRYFTIPAKTAHDAIDTPLAKVWPTVGPLILALLKARGIKYSAMKPVRFSINSDELLGPAVVWIAIPPKSSEAGTVRDATPEILNILAAQQITGVTVEWYLGTVKKFDGPALMEVEDRTSPAFGLNHPFNVGLGVPIARQSDDAQGTLAFFFREVKGRHAQLPHPRQTNPQYILVCGNRRLALAMDDIEEKVDDCFRDLTGLARELAEAEMKAEIGGSKYVKALERKQISNTQKTADSKTLKQLFDEVRADWTDANKRRLGTVEWAPKISVGTGDRPYTCDIATFVVYEDKMVNFEANTLDFGDRYNARQLERLFWSDVTASGDNSIPEDLQLRITRVLPHDLVITPDSVGKNGKPELVVAKYGSKTKLTLGRYSKLMAYTCSDLGVESQEVAVFNFNKESSNFSDHGDSGSLIVTGKGDAIAVLHSGMPYEGYSHVTFGMPAYHVMELILAEYPYAEFYGITTN
ncbi:hypothetical protein LXA43DRAFT_1117173 [Ganoderma leucocontextum]|nr:hypothetical protein LXA43DRAFT_1117173 [Ganoderma leucocontextum]